MPDEARSDVLDGAELCVAGVVDEAVDPAVFLDDAVDDPPDVVVLGHVEGGDGTAPVPERLHVGRVAGRGVHLPALVEEGLRSRTTDTGRTARDEDGLRLHTVSLGPPAVNSCSIHREGALPFGPLPPRQPGLDAGREGGV